MTFVVHSFVYSINSFAGSSSGLLGVWNGDKTDDLLAANGTTLDDASSLESIFYDFGESCKVIAFQSYCLLFCTSLLQCLFDFDKDHSFLIQGG